MAVDEVLLEAAVERGETVVRWYRWDRATVSLGYFQPAVAAGSDSELARLPAVRRLTGGGAILHHHELTYSCAIPPDHPLAREPVRLYAEVHTAAVRVLAARGVAAAMRGSLAGGGDGAFLCFGRGDPRDVIVAGHKVLGSAQRRRRGAVMQHGSLLLEASPFAPEFPGVNDLANRCILGIEDVQELAAAVALSLAPHGEVKSASLTPDEQERAALLEEQRYRRLDWHR